METEHQYAKTALMTISRTKETLIPPHSINGQCFTAVCSYKYIDIKLPLTSGGMTTSLQYKTKPPENMHTSRDHYATQRKKYDYWLTEHKSSSLRIHLHGFGSVHLEK